MSLLDQPPSRGLDETPHTEATADFATVDEVAWRQRVTRELGDTVEPAALTHRTRDGLNVEPLYTAASGPSTNGLAGGQGAAASPDNLGWRVAQKISQPEVEDAATQAEEAQAHGATLLWMDVAKPASAATASLASEPQAIQITGGTDLEPLLEVIDPGNEVVVDVGEGALTFAALQASRLGDEKAGVWHFACDPLAQLASQGQLSESTESVFRQMADLTAWGLLNAPEMHTVFVSAQPYHEAGGSTVQELAFALATGVEYLRHLSQAGLEVEAVSRRVDFSFSIGRDLFTEVAKLRAAKMLWSKALATWGGSPVGHRVRIHAHTSHREMSLTAPRVNLLRQGAQAFAAGLGGAYSLVIAPYDAVSGPASTDSRRSALNIQHILEQETRLGRVSDPAAGSWYVEHLTDALARAAWELFREVEHRGGMTACLLDGYVAELVTDSAAALREDVATRRQPLIGSSLFVELSEPSKVETNDVGSKAAIEDPLAASILDSVAEALDDSDFELDEFEFAAASLTVLELSVAAPGELGELMELSIAAADAGAQPHELAKRLAGESTAASCPPLTRLRLSQAFEDLRQASDRWLAELDTRPRAALVDLGVDHHTGFVRRLLAVAGIEGIEMPGLEHALQDSTWNLAVLCGHGARDLTQIRDAVEQFRRQGTRWVLVDHSGGDQKAALEAAGVDGFIFEGCDVLALLRTILEGLGAFA